MPEQYKDHRDVVIRQNMERMQRARAREQDALLVVRNFNARLSANRSAGFWPTIETALDAKHRWLVILCESCDTVLDLDLSMKPRDPEASVRVALRDVKCPRCNGHGRPRVLSLSNSPSI